MDFGCGGTQHISLDVYSEEDDNNNDDRYYHIILIATFGDMLSGSSTSYRQSTAAFTF